MPTGTRIRANNVYGVISDNPLSAAASVYNSVSLPLLPVVSSAHAIIVFDPKRVYGDPEIVVVTAHTASSTAATILRGQYGTSPRQHVQGTAWAHVPVNEDWTQILTSTTRPSDPYRGQAIFETDTNRYSGRSTADAWQQMGFFFDPPYCSLTQSAALTHTANGTWQVVGAGTGIAWDTENVDTANLHSTTVNPTRVTIPVAGLYLLTANIAFNSNATGARAVAFKKNGVGTGPNIEGRSISTPQGSVETTPSTSAVVKLAVNDFIEVVGYQSSGGNLAYTVILAEMTLAWTVTWIGRGN